MNHFIRGLGIVLLVLVIPVNAGPLGLPALDIPKNNPLTKAKIRLGDKLFHDSRFSLDGTVSCSTCHARKKAFTDSPLAVSEGIKKLTGTRNAPTVVNSAYMKTLFWDGREPDLEGQSTQPFLNPVEMALPSHQPILNIVRSDKDYRKMFHAAFKKSAKKITMKEVSQAIASFERTIISGNSGFDRYYFGGDKKALNEKAIRGLKVFLDQGRCVSCHTIDQNHALFTDNRFHNLGVSFARIDKDIGSLVKAYDKAKAKGTDVDVAVLTNKNTSELGRYAVTGHWSDIGSFKTPTLRNIAVTAPYMHDGSLEDLEAVVDFYDKGGRLEDEDPINHFQSGGLKPLNLSSKQKDDLVEFLQALTSPEYD